DSRSPADDRSERALGCAAQQAAGGTRWQPACRRQWRAALVADRRVSRSGNCRPLPRCCSDGASPGAPRRARRAPAMTGARFAVTFFADHGAQTNNQRILTLPELAQLIRNTTAPEKARLPWLKLARFGNAKTQKGSLRHDRNVIACSGLE